MGARHKLRSMLASGWDGDPRILLRAERTSRDLVVARRIEDSEPVRELPAAVLVFRDGDREKFGKYVVVGTTLMPSAARLDSGSWTRKIESRQRSCTFSSTPRNSNQERYESSQLLASVLNEVTVRP